MATTITRYVDCDSSGGDGTTTSLSGGTAAYASLYACLNAEVTARANLVSRDEVLAIICRSSHASHTADSAAAGVSASFTTDATRYISISVEASSRHAGVWDDTKYRMVVPTGSAGLSVATGYVRIEGMQFDIAASGSGAFSAASAPATSDVRFSTFVIKGPTGGSGNAIQVANVNQIRIWNGIIYGAYRAIYASGGCPNVSVYNVTAISNGDYGLLRCKFINCLSSGHSSGDFLEAQTGSNYNASGDTTGDDVGANCRASQTFTFVNAASKDYHLASTDAGARDFGISDPGSGLFADDIDGVTRAGTWDIGADEYASGGGGSTFVPQVIMVL